MRKLLFLSVLLISALLITACESDGELRIRNRTASDVWVSVDNSEPQHLAAGTNWSKFFSENRTAAISYNGNYIFANTVTKEVRRNLVTTLDLNPDGGAIQITNDGATALSEMYMSPAGDPNWGDDDLAGVLLPGESTLWTVTEGNWDLKAVDINSQSHFIYSQPVTTDHTLSLLISSFAKGTNYKKDNQNHNK